MKRIQALLLTACIMLTVLSACADTVPSDLMQNITPSSDQPAKAPRGDIDNASVTDFAVRLFQNCMEEGKNTLISPLSVLVALSMTANGAEENTLAQMEAVLGMPVDELNVWIKAYMDGLPVGEKYKLNMANSIWFRDIESFSVKEDFLQTNADYYNADIYKAPFDETTRDEINTWVEDNTDGMIKDILNKVPKDVVMYLINALAFDAEWMRIYREYEIRDGVFTTEGGIQKDAEMMYSEENIYLEDKNAVGFVKYYANRKYAFAALLPNEGVTVAEYIAGLTGEHLNSLLSNVRYEIVNTALPKFEAEYNVEMQKILSDMGMSDAFDAYKADFSGIGSIENGILFISRVLHKTYINVDEKGTKAGAATVLEMSTECAVEIPKEPKKVYLDRPFVYMLIDCETNLPFFIGTMMDMEG